MLLLHAKRLAIKGKLFFYLFWQFPQSILYGKSKLNNKSPLDKNYEGNNNIN